ncbi:hypothetical protein MHB71_05190 [Paenibacillus sp. FSL H7-0940]|uniref:hypothetical protein n=1 Tax=Paenibacillus sp. FSL H7-0940 TaxID=2921443 RepID=UPI0030EF1EC1
MEDFITQHFDVQTVEQGKVVQWDSSCATTYSYFVQFFGGVIDNSLRENKTYVDTVKSMINESITKNYGLAEYIIRHTQIQLF